MNRAASGHLRPSLNLSAVVLIVVGVFLGLAPKVLYGQTRVAIGEALTHVVKRIDPTLPPLAAAAKVGGTVYADVVIRADGTVEAVEIADGAEMLRPNAIAALKQWTFAPFLQNGKAARVAWNPVI